MPLHIIEEANRCLNCKRPMCQQGCPVHTSIPQVIQLFKAHEMDQAGQTLFANNPMSVVCSLVCNHGAQCEGHCVRGRKGSPIHFSAIENYVYEVGPVFRTAIFDEDDKVVGYEDELDQVACGTVVIAVSQKPKNRLITTTPGLEGDERGLLVVDDNCMTTVPGVFAAGDVVTGPKTVVHAVEAAKRATDGILAYLGLAA